MFSQEWNISVHSSSFVSPHHKYICGCRPQVVYRAGGRAPRTNTLLIKVKSVKSLWSLETKTLLEGKPLSPKVTFETQRTCRWWRIVLPQWDEWKTPHSGMCRWWKASLLYATLTNKAVSLTVPSARAEMTFPRDDRDLLMFLASSSRAPSAPVLLTWTSHKQ